MRFKNLSKIYFILLFISAQFLFVSDLYGTTIVYPSKDGLSIIADTYITNEDKSTPFLVLFHQAGWSRGEYFEIAPELNKLGFNCMAVDLRSGAQVNGAKNETAKLADSEGKKVTYVDAVQDIEASLEYARKNYASGKLIAWGSSYSAALVLKVAGDNPGLVDGVISFAPGEYFAKLGKSQTWIQESAKNIKVPVFITSARDEKNRWSDIYDVIPSKNKTSYVPKTKGNHGSRALWKKFGDNQGYWDAVTPFLQSNFQN